MRKLIFALLLVLQSSAVFAYTPDWALMGSPVLYDPCLDSFDNVCRGGFHDGVAVVQKEEDGRESLYGVINTAGEQIVPFKYKSISDFDKGMAIVETAEGKKGMINTLGNFLLAPEYDNITRDEYEPNLYIVEKYGQKGVFYDSKMVLPLDGYDEYNTRYFPNIKYGGHLVYNVFTGKTYENVFILDHHLIGHGKYYTFDGEYIEPEKAKTSSKGVTWFYDEVAKKYGLKNIRTKRMICRPVYDQFHRDIWIYDRLIAQKNGKYCIIGANGKEIPFKTKYRVEPVQFEAGGYITVSTKDFDADGFGSAMGLFDINGNCLIEPEQEYVTHTDKLGDEWFSYDGWTANVKTKSKFKGVVSPDDISDGMLRLYDMDKHKHYYLNIATGRQVGGYYDDAEPFSEGLARVSNDYDEKKFINKQGRVVLDLSEFRKVGYGFSEGVVAVKTSDYPRVTGYVYSPEGKYKYKYNQKNASKAAINKWLKEGDDAYNKKQYGKAKDFYYRAMVNDPRNTAAIMQYGYCVYQLGFLDESLEAYAMAVDIDPDNKMAKDNYKIIQSAIARKKAEAERARQQAQQQPEQQHKTSGNIWKALSNFANVFMQAYTGTTGFNQYNGDSYGSASASGSYGGYDSSSSASSSSSADSGHYQSMYDRWARNAESNYNSLTLMGGKATAKDGSKHGSSGGFWGSSNYVQLKRGLREAQREMKKIRREASRAGVTIMESQWENASVSY